MMKRRRTPRRWRPAARAALMASAVALGATTVCACVDLFHSTADVLTACEIDGRVPGCDEQDARSAAPAAPDAGPADACAE